MKSNIYLIVASIAASALVISSLSLHAEPATASEVNESAKKLNEQSQRLLDEQVERFKRVEALLKAQEDLLKKNEDLMKKQEEAFKRYQAILDMWERQQQQYQKYLNTLSAK